MIGPKGKFMLQPDDDRVHIFISSGTGNAPFVSMMRQLLIDGAPRPAVFLNGVSYASELGYKERVEGWARSGEYPVTFVPTVSRPQDPANAGWMGRTGRVEMILAPVLDELGLTPANSIAYICGNPDMILSAEETLLGRGYPEELVHKELYWPKGKEPRGMSGADLASAIKMAEANADEEPAPGGRHPCLGRRRVQPGLLPGRRPRPVRGSWSASSCQDVAPAAP